MYELFVVFVLMTPASSELETRVSAFQFEDVCDSAAVAVRAMAGSLLVGDAKAELAVTATCVRKTRQPD